MNSCPAHLSPVVLPKAIAQLPGGALGMVCLAVVKVCTLWVSLLFPNRALNKKQQDFSSSTNLVTSLIPEAPLPCIYSFLPYFLSAVTLAFPPASSLELCMFPKDCIWWNDFVLYRKTWYLQFLSHFGLPPISVPHPQLLLCPHCQYLVHHQMLRAWDPGELILAAVVWSSKEQSLSSGSCCPGKYSLEDVDCFRLSLHEASFAQVKKGSSVYLYIATLAHRSG